MRNGIPRPVRSPRWGRVPSYAPRSLAPPTAALVRSLLPRFGGRVPINAAPSLPPHNRGSLAGARAPPPLLRRVRRREWFSCCSWLLLSATRCGRDCRGSRAARLAALFVCVSCLRPSCLWLFARQFLGSYRFGLPVSRPLSQARSLARRGLSAPAGLPSRAPSPAAALWVGRVGFPPCRSAPSSRPLALLRRHSGLPLRGCFCPAVAGLVSFSPFRPPPASSLRCGCAPRFALGTRAPSRRSWCASPLPPFRGVGSAVGLSFVFISEVLAPLTRGWLSPLRFVAPSDDTSSCLRLWLLLACPLRGYAAPRCPVGLLVCMRVFCPPVRAHSTIKEKWVTIHHP